MFPQAWGGTLSKVLKFAEIELDKGGWPSNNLAARASSAAYTGRPDRGQPWWSTSQLPFHSLKNFATLAFSASFIPAIHGVEIVAEHE